MTRLLVDTDRLAEFVDRVEHTQAQLTRARDDADARIRQLQSGWDGTAAQAQAAAHAHWQAAATQAQEALAALHSIARTAHANYTAAVLANRRIWAG
jgi:WXG100 family type VII secretion target